MRLAVAERIDLVNQLYHPFERRPLVGCLASQPHFLYFRWEEQEIWTDTNHKTKLAIGWKLTDQFTVEC